METSPIRQKPKGKQKMEEEFEEEEGEGEISSASGGSDPTAENRCGICLSDVGGSIRGHIDSCEHSFCFVCIMEWSKVETRCPMCKQRFRSVCRPATPGIFIYERVVDVPERNQFYNGLGNASQTLSDPYANITCCECLSCRDEELLLLCDLCDSASHTYCAGLGATVPEGDWYCRDCTKIKTEHSKEESDSKVCNQDSYNSLREVRSSQDPVSIFEIISDGVVSVQEFSTEHDDLEQETEQPRGNTGRDDSEDHAVSNRARGEQHLRTLRQCRNLQDRIRQIRENWNFLGSGPITFSSRFNNSSNRDTNSKRKNRTNSGISRELEPVSSATNKQPADSSVTPKTRHSAWVQDEGKAWKMMKIAKSIDGSQKGSVPNHSSTSFSKSIIPKDVRNHNSGTIVAKGYSALHGLPGPATFKVLDKKHKFQSLEKEIPQSRKAQAEKEMGHSHRGPTKVLQSNNLEPYFYKPAGSSQEGICCLKKPILQQVADEKSTLSKGHDARAYRGSAICSVSESSSPIEIKPIMPSSSKVNSEGKSHGVITSIDKSSTTRNTIINCGAKDEIQSLVKLNLKLESKHKLLDADTFKEVARVATHTILAACGLEHSKSCARVISRSQCRHSEQIKDLHKSNLMPNSCRECFYSFVKHVVNSIFLEKIA